MGTSGTVQRDQAKGVGHVWTSFFAASVVLLSGAANTAVLLTGWPRVVGIIAVAALVPLTGWFGWLLYCWHAEKGRYKPPPPQPPFVASAADRTI